MQNLSYSFDAAGDLTAITDNLATTRSQSLHYDALYRLTQAAGAYGTYTYGYDAVGNRTSLGLTNGSGSTSSAYNYATTSNQVQTIVTGTTTRTLTYGATGNITHDDSGTGTTYGFAYNQDNRLAQALHGVYTIALYGQDYRGLRVAKAVPSQPNVTHFHYDRGGHVLAENIGTFGSFLREYVWLDDLPVGFVSNGALDYIHTDHLGTAQKMTDGSQTIVWDGGASDPFLFGQLPWSPQYMNLRFPGQYFDSETGLHHNGMRDYDPTLGRYIESDPIGLAGGINTYAYAGGNPLTYIDASGLAAQPCNDRCAELRKQIFEKAGKLLQELQKYDPVLDGLGGWPMRGGGLTKPGGHYDEIGDLKRGIKNDIAEYNRLCRDDDDGPWGPIPRSIDEMANRPVPPPVLPTDSSTSKPPAYVPPPMARMLGLGILFAPWPGNPIYGGF